MTIQRDTLPIVDRVTDFVTINQNDGLRDDLDALDEVWGEINGAKQAVELKDAICLLPDSEGSVSEAMIHKHGEVFRLSFYANHYSKPVVSVVMTADDLRCLVSAAASQMFDTIMLHAGDPTSSAMEQGTRK